MSDGRDRGAVREIPAVSPRRLRAGWAAVAGILLQGCALFGSGAIFGGSMRMVVSVAPDLNDRFPVAVEVVFAYDEAVAKQLLGLSAKDWFAGREQFLKDHPGGVVQSWKWEWVPGQAVSPPPIEFEYRVGSQPPIVYAGYSSPGDHRQQLRLGRDFALRLDRDDFRVEPLR